MSKVLLRTLNSVRRRSNKFYLKVVSLFSLMACCYLLSTAQPSEDTLLANKYYEKAERFHDLPAYDSAIIYYKKAAHIYKTAGDWSKYADTYAGLGENFNGLSQFDTAIIYMQIALEKSLELKAPNYITLAEVYHNLGYSYQAKADYDRALGLFHQALEIQLEQWGDTSIHVGFTYNNMGIIHYYKGDFEKALDFFNKGMEVRRAALGDGHPMIATSYTNIGFICGAKGDFDKELLYYKKALNIRIAIQGERHPEIATIYNNIGKCFGYKGDFEQQKIYADKALDIWFEAFGKNHFLVSRGYQNLASYYLSIEKFSDAIHYYELSFEILKNTVGERHGEVAFVHQEIGKCFAETKDYERALTHFEEALEIEIGVSGNEHPDVADNYNFIGKIHLEMKNWHVAQSNFQKALIAVVPDFESTDFHQNPGLRNTSSRLTLLDALQLKSTAMEGFYKNESLDINDLKFALTTSNMAMELTDKLRHSFDMEASVEQLSEKSMPVYLAALRQATQLYKLTGSETYLEQAFEIMERSRAFRLLLALRESGAKKFAGVPDSLLTLEKELRIDLAHYEKQLFEAEQIEDSAKTSLYQDYLFSRRSSYSKLIENMERSYPDYYKLKYVKRVTMVNDVRQAIRGDKGAVVEYFVGDSSIYIISVAENVLNLYEIAKPDSFEEQILDFRRLIASRNPDDANQVAGFFSKLAYEIYQMFLLPVIEELNPGTRKLIIIPDGVLSYIPFEILIDEPAQLSAPDYRQHSYLIKKFSINYSYSATLLLENLNAEKEATSGECLAFAPTYTGQESEPIASLRGNLETLRGFAVPLPGAQQEVKAIAGYFKGKFYFSDEATEQAFKKEASNFSIIHLAMHGFVDEKNPQYSKLSFAETADTSEDNALHTFELHNLNLNADLVVLSACETGYGKYSRGEGIMSLARGFMYAGCPSVVMSLWKIEDKTSAQLMTYFYESLSNGAEKDNALRQAKLRYLAEADPLSSHPFYWAGFVAIGNNQPVFSPKYGYWIFAICFLIFSCSLFFIFRKK